MAEHDSFVNAQISGLVFGCQFGVVLPQKPPMASLGVDSVKFYKIRLKGLKETLTLDEGTCMHHALHLLYVLGVGSDVNNHWLMLWQAGLEISFLPFELLILA